MFRGRMMIPAGLSGLLRWAPALALILFLAAPAASAQDKQEPPPAPKQAAADQAAPGKRFPVMVVHEGADLLGQRLALRLKERLAGSTLFKLADAGDKAIRLLVSSRAEIVERPGFGSAYSAVWLYAEGKDVLAYYLAALVGTVDEARIQAEAERLASRTDELAERYEYLFE